MVKRSYFEVYSTRPLHDIIPDDIEYSERLYATCYQSHFLRAQTKEQLPALLPPLPLSPSPSVTFTPTKHHYLQFSRFVWAASPLYFVDNAGCRDLVFISRPTDKLSANLSLVFAPSDIDSALSRSLALFLLCCCIWLR